MRITGIAPWALATSIAYGKEKRYDFSTMKKHSDLQLAMKAIAAVMGVVLAAVAPAMALILAAPKPATQYPRSKEGL